MILKTTSHALIAGAAALLTSLTVPVSSHRAALAPEERVAPSSDAETEAEAETENAAETNDVDGNVEIGTNADLLGAIGAEGIGRADFEEIISRLHAVYEPIVSLHGVQLDIIGEWEKDATNAFAEQRDGVWFVNIYGGLARHPEMTLDGLALILCHEIGHHMAGFPISRKGLANEGEADYYAAHVCAAKIWTDDPEGNLRAAEAVEDTPRALCDAKYQDVDRRGVCYRTSVAGLAVARFFREIYESDPVSFTTPDDSIVEETDHYHPDPQCRLDTFLAGSLCTAQADDGIIPGDDFRDDPLLAEADAYRYSCSDAGQARPRCWYKPTISL